MPIAAPITGEMRIRSAQGDYTVVAVASPEAAMERLNDENALLVIDERVASLYPVFPNAYAGRSYLLTATEEEKTLAGVERLCRFLQSVDASKRSRLTVVGGGITQDIAALAAHIYYRGIPYDLVPTTLLSMADSCIGAKSGVNLGEFKNQLGCFSSPQSVLLCAAFAATLDTNDIRSGFGEIVKLALTSGDEQFSETERHLDSYGFAPDKLLAPIWASLDTKRHVIEEDEYEHGLRKTLNYGHTFGHALEGITGHGVPHGLAVVWGIDVANFVAARRGLLEPATFERVHALLAKYFSLAVTRPYSADGIVRLMRRDKKATGGTVALILPSAIGALEIVPTPLDERLERDITDYMTRHDIFESV